MDEATHERLVSQALRIRESCKGDDEACVSIVARLLVHDPPLSHRQRETLIGAAVLMGRYGIGCGECSTAIKNMPREVQDAYRQKYGPPPPSCGNCRDTAIGSDGLRCLACDHLTPLEGAILVYCATGDPSMYEALAGRIDAINTHVAPSLVVRAEQRFIATRLAVREESGAVIISPQGHRRARLIFAAHTPPITHISTTTQEL